MLECNRAEIYFELFPIESTKNVNVLGNRDHVDLLCAGSVHAGGELSRCNVSIKRLQRRPEIWKKVLYSYFAVFT